MTKNTMMEITIKERRGEGRCQHGSNKYPKERSDRRKGRKENTHRLHETRMEMPKGSRESQISFITYRRDSEDGEHTGQAENAWAKREQTQGEHNRVEITGDGRGTRWSM